MIRLLTAALLFATPALAQPVTGHPHVLDGDSLRVAGTEVRLEGLDAPEWDQLCSRRQWKPRQYRTYRCGAEAKAALIALIAGRPVTCEGVVQPDGGVRDRYNRVLGICSAGGVELNAAMVESGHARAFVRYSQRYVPQEDRAREARRGIWAGPHMAPWDWRAVKRGGQ